MKPHVFIDSSVFILAKRVPSSNSEKIIELLARKEISCTVSLKVVHEVFGYFKKAIGKDFASEHRIFLLQSCQIVSREALASQMRKWKGKVKDKDLEHVATVKAHEIPFLIAYDRDFEPFSEYHTPRAFLQKFGKKARKTEY